MEYSKQSTVLVRYVIVIIQSIISGTWPSFVHWGLHITNFTSAYFTKTVYTHAYSHNISRWNISSSGQIFFLKNVTISGCASGLSVASDSPWLCRGLRVTEPRLEVTLQHVGILVPQPGSKACIHHARKADS